MSKQKTKKTHFSTKHTVIVFLAYTIIIFIILALINYMIFPLMYIFSLLGVSIVLGAIATFFHIRGGVRSEIDDIADEIAH